MALDSAAQAIVDAMSSQFPDLGGAVTAARTARAMLDAVPRPGAADVPVRRVQDMSVPNANGADIPVRVYWPDVDLDMGTPLPGIVFFHGGGFVLSSVDGHEAFARKLAVGAEAVVVSVDYRLAPEHRFPAAVDDAVAAIEWVHANTARLGVDPDRIAVAGDSSGGNLAAVTCLRARDYGGPTLAAQLLIYPVLDARQDSKSYQDNATGYFLTSAHMRWFWEQYLHGADPEDPAVSPVHAPDLAGLPPAVIVVGEHDVLADEGRCYAARLAAAGNQVTLLDYPGMFHGFFGLGERLPTAARANADVYDALRTLLAVRSPHRSRRPRVSDRAPAAQRDDDVEVDIVIVGAGFGGLYAVHHLRELGHRVVALEKGAGVGGTWYWNRYPGARCDVPSLEYSYGFSKELVDKWDWTEFMAGQEEIERYLNFVADHFDLRRDIHLRTKAVRCRYDEASARWTVDTAGGRRYRGRFLVMATGSLSVPLVPELPGADDFAGTWLRTADYPHPHPDLSSARVGLIGTGSSGVQAITELAGQAGQLTVFQRTASYVFPSHNRPMDPHMQRRARDLHDELRPVQRQTPLGLGGLAGFTGPPTGTTPIVGSTVEQRLAALEEKQWMAPRMWSDVFDDPEANEMAAEMYREMVRRTVRDTAVAEALSPRGLPLGCKRVILANGYFEAFNQPNVSLVDLRADPLVTVTPTGIRTRSGDHQLDVIILATGFDGMTGALSSLPIIGRDEVLLTDVWSQRVESLLGLQVSGFPNLFTLTGPGSPSVLANVVAGLEQHVDLVGECIAEIERRGARCIEPDAQAQREWSDHVNELAAGSMYTAPNCHSWYLGSNVPGKRRQLLAYVAGFDAYVRECDKVVADGFAGFVFS